MTKRLATLVLPRLEPLALVFGAALMVAAVATFDLRLGLFAAGLAFVLSALDIRRPR